MKVFIVQAWDSLDGSAEIIKLFSTEDSARVWLSKFKPMWFDKEGSITAWFYKTSKLETSYLTLEDYEVDE